MAEASDDSDIILKIFDEKENRPLMLLFKNLIRNDRITTIKNSEIEDILRLEFNLDISRMHEIQVELYLQVMKTFIKEWRKWSQFQLITTRLRSVKAEEQLKDSIEDKYRALKKHLQQALTIAKPIADDLIKEYIERTKDPKNVVLEVTCTRAELNQLFYRHPKGELSTDIFNTAEPICKKILVTKWDIASILNLWDVRVNINLNNLIYKREMTHKLKHVLINKVHTKGTMPTQLDTRLHEKSNKGKQSDIQMLLDSFSNILKAHLENPKVFTLLAQVFAVIEKDLGYAPDSIKVPAKYRQYLNQSAYVRYLYTDNGTPDTSTPQKYDLQLRETLSPMVEYHIGKIDGSNEIKEWPAFQDWFRIECVLCKIKFIGEDMMEPLQNHFTYLHQNGPNWECTNCVLKFDTKGICEDRWSHKCS